MKKRCIALLLCIIMLVPAALVPASAAAETELYNFAFDDEAAESQYFSFGDAVTGEWVSGDGIGHGDNNAIKVVHKEGEAYTSSSNTLILNLSNPLPAGGIYRIVAWTYVKSEENQGKGTLTGPGFVINGIYGGEQGDVKFPPDFGTMPVDEWKQIDVTLPLQPEPLSRLDFRFVINDADKHPDIWYWDNIEIYQVGELEEVDVLEGDSVTEEGYPIITRGNMGTHDGFDYELWSQKRTDPVSMTLTGGGTFQCEWDAQNVLFRTGKKMGSTQTYEEYGNISLDYTAMFNITRGAVSYLCMYGWTEDPMIEFYIIENHGDYKPPGGVGYKGAYEMDGGTYEVYVATRVEQPSIQGTKTFEQYFAVRTGKRTKGTLSISDHFKEWETLGLDMSGKMYEISMCVEGYQSSGNAEISEYILNIGDAVYGSTDEEPEPTVEPSAPAVTPAESEIEPPAPTETTESTDNKSVPDDKQGFPWGYAAIGAAAVAAALAVVFILKKPKGK